MPLDFSTIYMIMGFGLAAYAVVGNDSLQTLGTFLASNQTIKWYWIWLAASAVLVATLGYGWWANGGDVSWGRLDRIPRPGNFQLWHALAPASLLLLTRFGIPVSTTFLVLSVFASEVVIERMVIKSLLGWAIAAISAFAIWRLLSLWLDEHVPVRDERHKRWWRLGQWIATGFLWSQWLTHDMANIAVFLPRRMGVEWLLFALVIPVVGLGYIFRTGGGKIQRIILEKAGSRFARSATIIDLVYALILLVFRELNSIPMSTTWVFVGLLAGRELAIQYQHKELEQLKIVFPMLARDFVKVFFGAVCSVAIVIVANALIRLTGSG